MSAPRCHHCGYSLDGVASFNGDMQCPECGLLSPSTAPQYPSWMTKAGSLNLRLLSIGIACAFATVLVMRVSVWYVGYDWQFRHGTAFALVSATATVALAAGLLWRCASQASARGCSFDGGRLALHLFIALVLSPFVSLFSMALFEGCSGLVVFG